MPNTEQPYACVDMMMVGVILDKVRAGKISKSPNESTLEILWGEDGFEPNEIPNSFTSNSSLFHHFRVKTGKIKNKLFKFISIF